MSEKKRKRLTEIEEKSKIERERMRKIARDRKVWVDTIKKYVQ